MMNKVPQASSARGPKEETFEQYWERRAAEQAAREARDEELDEAAGA
jgi:hypothetical protein